MLPSTSWRGGQEDEDEFESTRIPQKLKGYLEAEVAAFKLTAAPKRLSDYSPVADLTACPFCVSKRFYRRVHGEEHLQQYHLNVAYGCTTQKILRLARADFDRDELRLAGEDLLFNAQSDFVPERWYIQRAVAVVRKKE